MAVNIFGKLLQVSDDLIVHFLDADYNLAKTSYSKSGILAAVKASIITSFIFDE